uniref:Uncharacterized protein n=1 Tax=viral metagenome TaxID=1070528 RepID=A0A6C0KH43_9ZZZZ
MVKNTTGGSGAKSSARKFASSHSAIVPLPTHPDHRIAIVQKMHGPHCDVIFHDHSTSIAHIRNKFKGRHKRFNIIKTASFILVAIRDFQLNHSDIFLFLGVLTQKLKGFFSLEPWIQQQHNNNTQRCPASNVLSATMKLHPPTTA